QDSVCNAAQFPRQYKTTLLHKSEKELNYRKTEESPNSLAEFSRVVINIIFKGVLERWICNSLICGMINVHPSKPYTHTKFSSYVVFYEIPRTSCEQTYTKQWYIIFTNPEMEEFEHNFTEHVENLKNTPYWNPRSNFLVFACGKLNKPHAEFAHTVLRALKKISNIINVNIKAISAYTLFPYINGACNQDVIVLIGKWNAHNIRQDSLKSIDFFPNKVPKHFTGCFLNISAFGAEPYLIVKTYKSENGENKFIFEGIGLELINLFAREVNLTPNFLNPVTSFEPEDFFQLFETFTTGIIDILGGSVPTVPHLKPYADLSVPLLIDTLKYVVPCPKPMKKTDKIAALFSLSTWISMGLVFITV
ncbi:hypothetical protein L9F63_003990, partial [Diploptera punctata]